MPPGTYPKNPISSTSDRSITIMYRHIRSSKYFLLNVTNPSIQKINLRHKIQRLELNLDVGMSLRIVISITECNSNISNKFIPNFEDYQFVINIYSFKINTFIILFSIVSLNLG